MYSKPNSGVLNYPTNVVLTGDEAKPVHLEGFADAWNEPIKKLEFSFDHGATWTTLDTPNNDSQSTGPTGAWTSRRPRPGRT